MIRKSTLTIPTLGTINAHAFFFDDYAKIPYFILIIDENIKRYKQLDDIQKFEKLINEGVIDVHGLSELLSIDKKTKNRGTEQKKQLIKSKEMIKKRLVNRESYLETASRAMAQTTKKDDVLKDDENEE